MSRVCPIRFPRRRRAARTAAFVAAILAILVPGGQADAQQNLESFEIGLSTDRIAITSDFSGTRLVVFGALDNADARIRQQQRYDIVVAMIGPRRPVVVRRKERTLGIWINRGSEQFSAAPSSYALSSTRPLPDVAPEKLRVSLSIGISDLRLSAQRVSGIEQAGVAGRPDETRPAKGAPAATEPGEGLADTAVSEATPPDAAGMPASANRDDFAGALRRIRAQSGLYNQSFGTVRFVSPTLFRADLQLPADLPVGRHTVRAYLFRNGVFIRQSTETLLVVKAGFESYISDLAQHYALPYGVLAVALAIFTGWFGRVVFKRD